MKENASGGIGVLGLLFIVFLVLKLTKVITWSWWWVTAPLWGPPALFLSIVMVIALIGGIIYYFKPSNDL